MLLKIDLETRTESVWFDRARVEEQAGPIGPDSGPVLDHLAFLARALVVPAGVGSTHEWVKTPDSLQVTFTWEEPGSTVRAIEQLADAIARGDLAVQKVTKAIGKRVRESLGTMPHQKWRPTRPGKGR